MCRVLDDPDPEVVFIGWSAILNISMDNELVQSGMVKEGICEKVLQTLVRIFSFDHPKVPESKEQNIIVACLKVYSNILEADDALQALLTSTGGRHELIEKGLLV